MVPRGGPGGFSEKRNEISGGKHSVLWSLYHRFGAFVEPAFGKAGGVVLMSLSTGSACRASAAGGRNVCRENLRRLSCRSETETPPCRGLRRDEVVNAGPS